MSTYVQPHLHTQLYVLCPSVLIWKCESIRKHLGTEKWGAGTHSVTVVASGPVGQPRRCRKDIKTQAAPERPHTAALGSSNIKRKLMGDVGSNTYFLAELSHCLLII